MIHTVLKLEDKHLTHHGFLLKPALKLAVKQDCNYQNKSWNHKKAKENSRHLFVLAEAISLFFGVGFYCSFSISSIGCPFGRDVCSVLVEMDF